MFLNFISLFLIYSFFFIIILSAGKIANNFIFQFKNLYIGEHGILGFFFIYSIVLIIHFFIPITDLVIFFIYSIFFIYFLFNLKKILFLSKIGNYKYFFIFLIFLILSVTNNHHDDLYIYQLPIINYMQNYKIIFGFINLNDFIGQGHSFYEIMSFFKVPFFENRAYFLLPIIFLNFFVLFLFENLKIEKNQIVKYFIYFIILLLIIRFNRSKEYGTDLPILCLLLYIQINFFYFISSKNLEFFYKAVLASLFSIILKLYGILSLFYLLAFLPILKNNFLDIFGKKRYFTFLISVFLLTLLKNIIVSGCLAYPISKTCLNKSNFSWSIGKDIADSRNEFYNAQVLGWRSYTKNVNDGKFLTAEQYKKKKISEKIKGLVSDNDRDKILTGIILLSIFILILILSKDKIKIYKIKKPNNILILLCLFLPLLIWLLKLPQSRYGYFAYLSCLIFYISFQFFKVGEINKKFTIIIFTLLIAFLVFKNVTRIYYEVKNLKKFQNYPIKNFRVDEYEINYINKERFNIPKNSFMECGNIPMLCLANVNMISNVKIISNYIFLKNNNNGLKQHINSSAIYDMIETNK